MRQNRDGTSPLWSGLDRSTPVLVLGGKENSLSIVRHLGSNGIEVACSGPREAWGLYSRHCARRFVVPVGADLQVYWQDLLLGGDGKVEPGTILLPCSDEALRFIARHDGELRVRYRYDEASPVQRVDLLDKQRTLEIALEAGVDAPQHWPVSDEAGLMALKPLVRLPAMIKPLDTFRFAKAFGRKLFIVTEDFGELADKARLAWSKGHQVMVAEMVPGPDSLLSSYYSYMTGDGEPLFHFTKRVLRRFPVNSGGATYHVTDWLPQTASAGLRFFRNSGFRGLGNIEFKRDPRDGKLKIIEVNARFTAAQELAVRAGMPIDLMAYRHLTGQPIFAPPIYEQDVTYWYPLRDTLACLQLWRRGELTLGEWWHSLAPPGFVSPIHSIADMRPSLSAAAILASKLPGRLLRG